MSAQVDSAQHVTIGPEITLDEADHNDCCTKELGPAVHF